MASTPQSSGSSNLIGSSLLTIGQNIVTAINAITAAITGQSPRIVGTFQMPAAATFAVPQPAIKGGGVPLLTPTNAAAATLMGSAKALYVSSVTQGTGFSVATASGAAATGAETFSYAVINSS